VTTATGKGDVLSYSEDGGLASELARGAASLASATGGRALSVLTDPSAPATAAGGALLLRAAGSAPIGGELVEEALAAAVRAMSPAVLLIGATRRGRQVAAKLAVSTGMGVLSDVTELSIGGEDGALSGKRGVYAGRYRAKVASPLPCIALVPHGAFEEKGSEAAAAPSPAAPLDRPAVEELDVGTLTSRVRLVETRPKPKGSVDLRSAEVIVSAGRGFKKREDLALAEELARTLGGALGASRPLSSDLGWLGEEYHVGLTGIYVRPRLYVAVGISGQLQHVAGIKDSRLIVAINKDKQAPIFQVADYGIVGDLYQVLPALVAALRG